MNAFPRLGMPCVVLAFMSGCGVKIDGHTMCGPLDPPSCAGPEKQHIATPRSVLPQNRAYVVGTFDCYLTGQSDRHHQCVIEGQDNSGSCPNAMLDFTRQVASQTDVCNQCGASTAHWDGTFTHSAPQFTQGGPCEGYR